MTDLNETARRGVVSLEENTGMPLNEVPVSQRDQYCAMVRDTFMSMGVDLSKKDQANAAFIGAHVSLSTFMTQGPTALVASSHLLRYLMDRSDGIDPRASKWTRLKVRIARWLIS